MDAPPPPPPPPVTRIEVGAGIAGSMGLLPELTALGAQVDATIDAPAIVPVHAFASYWLDRTTPGADFSMALAGAGVCPAIVRSTMAKLYACAHGEVGLLRASGTSPFDPVRPTAAPLFDLDAGIRLTLTIVPPFVARGGAAIVVPILRDDFVVGARSVFRVSPVAALADLGFGVSLP